MKRLYVASVVLLASACALADSKIPSCEGALIKDSAKELWCRQEQERGCQSKEISCKNSQSYRPSFGSLTLELAATHKTIADQLFLLDGNRTEATEQYCKAQSFTRQIDRRAKRELSPADQELHTLLIADIEYRKELLRGNASFWGLQGARPTPPLKQLAAFNANLATYESIATSVTESIKNIGVNNAQINYIAGHEITSRLEKFKSETRQSIQEININKYQNARRAAASRLIVVRGEISKAEREASALASQADSLNAAIGQAIMDGAAAAAGVPPGVIGAIKDGNVNKAIQGIAISALADPSFAENPNVASALGNLTERAPELRRLIGEYQKISGKIEQANDQIASIRFGIDSVGNFARDPSFGNLVTVGNAAWSKLPQTEKDQLMEGIKKSKPIGTMVKIAGQPDSAMVETQVAIREARDRVSTAVATIDTEGKRLATQTSAFVDAMTGPKNWQSVAAIYKDIYSETAANLNLLPSVAEKLLTRLVEVVPERFVDWLEQKNPKALNVLLAQNGLRIKEELVALIRKTGLGSIKALDVQNVNRNGGVDAVYVIDNGKKILIAEIPVAFREISADLGARGNVNKLITNLKENYVTIAEQGPDARKRLTMELLKKAPIVIERVVNTEILVDENLKNVKDAHSLQQRLWQAASKGGDDQMTKITVEMAAKVSVGTNIAKEEISRQKPASNLVLQDAIANPVEPASPASPTSPDQAKLQAIVTAGLNAAFPGAGVAVGIVSNMIALQGMWNKMNDLFEDEKRLLAEENHLIATMQIAEVDGAIAQKELSVAEASTRAAAAQIALWQQSTADIAGELSRERVRLRSRRPLVFFTGEQLRKDFELFNRSMTTWTGVGNAGETFLESYIRGNPQYLRFAIDHDIQLYTWLNRERDGARVDLDLVSQRWSQKKALMEAACKDGLCIPGLGQNMEMNQGSARLSSLLNSSSRSALSNLLIRKRGSEEFRLVVSPVSAPLRAEDRNVRLLDIRMNWIGHDGKPLAGVVRGATLHHSGSGMLIGANQNRITTRHEILAEQSQTSFEEGPFVGLRNEFGLATLTLNNQIVNLPSTRFYGYPPITTWTLLLDGSSAPADARDLMIHMAFTYQGTSTTATETDYVEMLKMRNVTSDNANLNEIRNRFRNEFPVPWYRFVATNTKKDEKLVWVNSAGGPLSVQDVLLRPGMTPVQLNRPSFEKEKHGYCEGELHNKLETTQQKQVVAVCLPRSTLIQSLSNHVFENGRTSDGLKSLNEREAKTRVADSIKMLDESHFCDCGKNADSTKSCVVQGAL